MLLALGEGTPDLAPLLQGRWLLALPTATSDRPLSAPANGDGVAKRLGVVAPGRACGTLRDQLKARKNQFFPAVLPI
jgi:hypothetical protein